MRLVRKLGRTGLRTINTVEVLLSPVMVSPITQRVVSPATLEISFSPALSEMVVT